MLSLFLLLRGMVRASAALLRNPETKALPFLALATLATGTLFYWRAEDWSVLDSLYFSVTTLTTVGLGDVAPATDKGKIFTIIYIFVGLGVLVGFVTALGAELVRQHQERGSGR